MESGIAGATADRPSSSGVAASEADPVAVSVEAASAASAAAEEASAAAEPVEDGEQYGVVHDHGSIESAARISR